MSRRGEIFWWWLIAGAGLACWGGYELAAAFIDARQTGTIAVSPFGRSQPRHVVTWPRAWAFVLGHGLMLSAGIFAMCEAVDLRRRWTLPSIPLLVPGFTLVLFSAYLSSLGGMTYLVVFSSGIALLFYLQRRYGKWRAVGVWAIVVAIGVYWMTRSANG